MTNLSHFRIITLAEPNRSSNVNLHIWTEMFENKQWRKQIANKIPIPPPSLPKKKIPKKTTKLVEIKINTRL